MGKRFFSFALALALCLGLAFPAAASYTTVTAGEYTTISCGSQHMAAIDTDGSLWMWGRNDYGQLGNGASKNKYSIISSEECSYFPVKVMDHVVAFDCGRYNTIALKTDGTVWAWGYNRYGQVGNGGVGDARPNYNYGDRCQTLPVKVMDNIRLPDAKPVPTVGGFRDVHENDYFADPVLWAVDNNVTAGTSATQFSPNSTCTRGQIVTFLYRAFGK